MTKPTNEPVCFFLDIEPVPQERLRFNIRGRGKYMRVIPYMPERTATFQASIREAVREYMREHKIPEFPKSMPLQLEVLFILSKPKTAKRIHPTVRPDLSNYLKLLEDGIQRKAKEDAPALIEDDSSICSIFAEKRYVCEEYPTPGILVTLREFGDET